MNNIEPYLSSSSRSNNNYSKKRLRQIQKTMSTEMRIERVATSTNVSCQIRSFLSQAGHNPELLEHLREQMSSQNEELSLLKFRNKLSQMQITHNSQSKSQDQFPSYLSSDSCKNHLFYNTSRQLFGQTKSNFSNSSPFDTTLCYSQSPSLPSIVNPPPLESIGKGIYLFKGKNLNDSIKQKSNIFQKSNQSSIENSPSPILLSTPPLAASNYPQFKLSKENNQNWIPQFYNEQVQKSLKGKHNQSNKTLSCLFQNSLNDSQESLPLSERNPKIKFSNEENSSRGTMDNKVKKSFDVKKLKPIDRNQERQVRLMTLPMKEQQIVYQTEISQLLSDLRFIKTHFTALKIFCIEQVSTCETYFREKLEEYNFKSCTKSSWNVKGFGSFFADVVSRLVFPRVQYKSISEILKVLKQSQYPLQYNLTEEVIKKLGVILLEGIKQICNNQSTNLIVNQFTLYCRECLLYSNLRKLVNEESINSILQLSFKIFKDQIKLSELNGIQFIKDYEKNSKIDKFFEIANEYFRGCLIEDSEALRQIIRIHKLNQIINPELFFLAKLSIQKSLFAQHNLSSSVRSKIIYLIEKTRHLLFPHLCLNSGIFVSQFKENLGSHPLYNQIFIDRNSVNLQQQVQQCFSGQKSLKFLSKQLNLQQKDIIQFQQIVLDTVAVLTKKSPSQSIILKDIELKLMYLSNLSDFNILETSFQDFGTFMEAFKNWIQEKQKTDSIASSTVEYTNASHNLMNQSIISGNSSLQQHQKAKQSAYFTEDSLLGNFELYERQLEFVEFLVCQVVQNAEIYSVHDIVAAKEHFNLLDIDIENIVNELGFFLLKHNFLKQKIQLLLLYLKKFALLR